MARHRLSNEEQKKGVEKALASTRTPPQLKKGLKKREKELNENQQTANSDADS